MHPAAKPGKSLGAAKIQHPMVILPGNKLPCSALQMGPYDAPVVEGGLEGFEGRLSRSHGHGPAHGLVILSLHSAEPRHHIRRVFQLRNNELLAQKACGYRIHS